MSEPVRGASARPPGSLADLLAARRTELGLSQEALAAEAGMSVRAVRDLEAGRVRVPQQRSATALVRVLALTGADQERFWAMVSGARRDRARFRAGAGAGAGAGGAPSPRDAPPGAFAYPAPAQLPPAPADFTGRTAEAAALRRLLLAGTPPGPHPAGAAMAAVTGEGGLGKTALALHAAHRARGDFPDGQLYVDLGASRGAPLDIAGLLARLLRGLGVPGGGVPPGTDARAVLYRQATYGRRLLVVLDDAPGAVEVWPLLPGGPASVALVTSRHRYGGRARTAGEVRLGPLSPVASGELLARLAGPARVAAEPEAAAAVVARCAGSPLALRVTAARLARYPRWSIAAVLGRLAADQRSVECAGWGPC